MSRTLHAAGAVCESLQRGAQLKQKCMLSTNLRFHPALGLVVRAKRLCIVVQEPARPLCVSTPLQRATHGGPGRHSSSSMVCEPSVSMPWRWWGARWHGRGTRGYNFLNLTRPCGTLQMETGRRGVGGRTAKVSVNTRCTLSSCSMRLGRLSTLASPWSRRSAFTNSICAQTYPLLRPPGAPAAAGARALGRGGGGGGGGGGAPW